MTSVFRSDFLGSGFFAVEHCHVGLEVAAGRKDAVCRQVSITDEDGVLHKLAVAPFHVAADQVAHVFAGRFVKPRFADHSIHEFSQGLRQAGIDAGRHGNLPERSDRGIAAAAAYRVATIAAKGKITAWQQGRVFSDSELQADSVIRNFRITAAGWKSYNTQHYNLAAIIAVATSRHPHLRHWHWSCIDNGYTLHHNLCIVCVCMNRRSPCVTPPSIFGHYPNSVT
ncbi:MAG: hypothetical protein ACR2I0_10525 [Rhodoferax sp.]